MDRHTGLAGKLLPAALLLCTAGLLYWPQQAVQAAREGLLLCGSVIVPSLFPFFILSSLSVELGLTHCLGRLLHGLMGPLFRLDGCGASALALGLIGGYPVGARTAVTLYEQGQCSRSDAQRLLAFCNNSGPAFIFGVVGAGVFGSGKAGALLYFIHIAAALLAGVLFRFGTCGESSASTHPPPSFHAVNAGAAFARSVTGAVSPLLNICAFVVCFRVLLHLLQLSGVLSAACAAAAFLLHPLGFDRVRAEQLLTGLVELSSGISTLSGPATPGQLSLAAFMLGWGGLSVHGQVLALLENSDLSMAPYLGGKLLHGLLSAALMYPAASHLGFSLPADSCAGYSRISAPTLPFPTLSMGGAVVAALVLPLFVFYLLRSKKSGGKVPRAGV